MALVKEEVYTKWLKKDHWIYRQFSYIFNNQIWQKDVPKGYPLCVYFWTSILLGFCTLKLFVVPSLLVLGAIVKYTMGRPEAWFREMWLGYLDSHSNGRGVSFTTRSILEHPGGGPILSAIVMSAIVLCAVGGYLLGKPIALAMEYGAIAVAITIATYGGILALIVCSIYSDDDTTYLSFMDPDTDSSERKRKRNIVTCGHSYVGITVLAWILYCRVELWGMLCALFVMVWDLIFCWMIAGMIAGLWSFLTASPDGFGVPYSVIVISAWVILIVLARSFKKNIDHEDSNVKPLLATADETMEFIVEIAFGCKYCAGKYIYTYMLMDGFGFPESHIMYAKLRRHVIKTLLEGIPSVMKDIAQLNLLKSDYDDQLIMKKWKLEASDFQQSSFFNQERFDMVRKILYQDVYGIMTDNMALSDHTLWGCHSEFQKIYKDEIARYMEIQKRHSEQKIKIQKPFVLFWDSLCRIGRGLKQVYCHTRDMIKAKKEGWCPYVIFEIAEDE